MKLVSTRWACLALLMVSGCASHPDFRSVAQTAQTAQLFDRLNLAVSRGDEAEVSRFANEFLGKKGEFLFVASAQALAKKGNAQMLNAIGWEWADKGTKQEHFKAAEILTRRAVKLMGHKLREAQRDGVAPNVILARFQRAMIRDSLAWALFRQKRYEEAFMEQQAALHEMKAACRQLGVPVPRELFQHLESIETALKSQRHTQSPRL